MSRPRTTGMRALDPSEFEVAAVPQPDPVEAATGRALSKPQTTANAKRAPAPSRSRSTTVSNKPPSREGRVQLSVWVSPELRAELKHISTDTGQSVGELVVNAIEKAMPGLRRAKR